MSFLKPNTTYIYERVDKKIYARESGSTERQLIGYSYGKEPNYADRIDWARIIEAAETNPSLANALDQVIMLYELTNEQSS